MMPTPVRPGRCRTLAALLFTGVALSGCFTTTDGLPPGGPTHAPFTMELKRDVHSVAVRVGPDGEPTAGDQYALDDAIGRAAAGRPEAVHATVRTSRSTAATASSLANVLIRSGLDPRNVQTNASDEVPPGTAQVVLERWHALAPECAGWSYSYAAPIDNKTSSHHACATMSNLSAMIADPRDLAYGRGTDEADGEREATAVTAYRTGKGKQIPRGGQSFGVGAGR